jgi:hypothetical protein
MSGWFGPKPADPKKIVKESKGTFRKSGRDIDREIRAIERDEQTLTAQIKKSAKSGDKKSAAIQAKSLVKLRASKQRLISTKAQMGGIEMQLKSTAATVAMADSMKVATKAASAMNKEMERANVMANLKEFERANQQMELKGEMMDDLLDGCFDDPEADGEVDSIIAEVTGEIALDASATMNSAGPIPNAAPVSAHDTAQDDFEARLAQLKF